MNQYIEFLKKIKDHGVDRMDRTQTGTRSIFGYEMRIPLDKFPLLTTKRVHFKSVVIELLWFLKGSSNVHWLQKNGCKIWNEWADENGNLGPVYGYQWRSWPDKFDQPIDQITQLIDSLKNNPHSRRHIVTAWNVAMLPEMALPPCHMLFQCFSHDGKLSLKITQRSADAFLGVPFNIASYALLCYMLAQVTGHVAHELIWSGGDCHIYHNHFDAINEQLSRKPTALPSLRLDPNITSIFDFTEDSIVLENYYPQSRITAPIAV